MTRRQAEARIEDTEWLVKFGAGTNDITHQVGFPSDEAAAGFFHACGRHDLAALFEYQEVAA